MIDVPDDLDLTAPQARVLGALIEKQLSTPDAYPMTLKALTTACNQTSNRDPVVDYEPQLVETTIHALKGKGVARIVHPRSGERSTKFRHVLDEALDIGEAETALLSVLLLRGAQTVNELRIRTERLHQADADAIEATLAAMSGGDRPLVQRLDPAPGQKEARWLQLLEVGVEERAAAAARSSGRDGSGGSRQAGRVEELEDRVARLEARVAGLVEALGDLVDLPEGEPTA